MSPVTSNIAVLHADAAQRDALCDFISDEVGFHVVGGSDGDGILDLIRIARTHVLVVDLASVDESAAELLSAVRALSPGTGILLLARGEPQARLEELMACGAAGYVDFARASAELSAALRTIGMGRRYRSTAEVVAR